MLILVNLVVVGCVLVVCRMKEAESAKGGYEQPFV